MRNRLSLNVASHNGTEAVNVSVGILLYGSNTLDNQLHSNIASFNGNNALAANGFGGVIGIYMTTNNSGTIKNNDIRWNHTHHNGNRNSIVPVPGHGLWIESTLPSMISKNKVIKNQSNFNAKIGISVEGTDNSNPNIINKNRAINNFTVDFDDPNMGCLGNDWGFNIETTQFINGCPNP